MKPPFLVRAVVLTSLIVGGVSALANDKPSLDDTLNTKVSFDCGDHSLAQVLENLATKLGPDHPEFSVQIMGDDLQREGITKNQRIRGLRLADKTVAGVLTVIVLTADPNSRVQEPSDPSLKLVWVVAADKGNAGRQVVLITTRAGVKKRGEKLPERFEPK